MLTPKSGEQFYRCLKIGTRTRYVRPRAIEPVRPRPQMSRTKWRRTCSKDICTPPRRSFGPAATRTHSRWYNRHGASVGAAAYCERVPAVSALARSGSRVSEVRRLALAKPACSSAQHGTRRANVYRVRAAWRAPRIMSTAPPWRPACAYLPVRRSSVATTGCVFWLSAAMPRRVRTTNASLWPQAGRIDADPPARRATEGMVTHAAAVHRTQVTHARG